MAAKGNGKVAMDEFITLAIKKLRANNKPDKQGRVSKGIHTVFSGFSGAFREYYGLDKDAAITAVDNLVKSGKFDSHFAKGGMMLYLKGEAPARAERDNKKVIASILG